MNPTGLPPARRQPQAPTGAGGVSPKRSDVHPRYKTKYRTKNWPAYDRALVARGDITLWITPEAREGWRPARTGNRGAQPKFSDVAIQTALTLRLVFHLPLR